MWWTVHLEGGPRRVNHAAVAVGEKIFSFGGYCTGDNYKRKTPIDLFVLNPHTYRWREIPKPRTESAEAEDWPYQRYGHTVCAFGTDIFLFGGRNDEAPCNIVYKFDTKTLTWSRPEVSGQIPPERDGHSACIIRGSMYVFGGYEESHSRYGQEVFKLDLSAMTWSLVHCKGEQPRYGDFHSATAIGDKMLVYGGRSETPGNFQNFGQEIYSNKLSYLDTKTQTWHLPSIPSPWPKGRRSHSAVNYGGRLMIFGGYNGRLNEHMNDIWMLDPEFWQWRQVRPHGNGPIPRRRQAMCLVGTNIYLFGGTSPYDGPPIDFTAEQQTLLHESDEQQRLIDHNDLFVLDLEPSLRTMCMITVIRALTDTPTVVKKKKKARRPLTTEQILIQFLQNSGQLPIPEDDCAEDDEAEDNHDLDTGEELERDELALGEEDKEVEEEEKNASAVQKSEPKRAIVRWDNPSLAQLLDDLPAAISKEMRFMTEGNTISKPLPLRLG